ncbi:thioredoxin family protein, partial [candidate division KSB1 bacterium]
GWMNSLKVILAFLILSFGTKFLTVTNANLGWNIPREVFIAFWFVNFILLTLYLLGKIKLPHDSDLPHIKIPRLFLAMITFVFAIYLLPGMIGAPVKLISGFVPSESSFDLKAIIEENKVGTQTNSVSGSSNICEEPKYADLYKLPYGLKAYFDYEQGLACAKKIGKPLFLDFKSKSCANCKVMERNIWPDPEVLKRLSEEYVIVVLYGDQKTELLEEEWITSTFDGKIKKTAGKRNKDLQITKFGSNAEPYYVLLGTDEKELVKPMGFTKSVEEYVQFLDEGIAKFKERNNKE